MPIVIACPSCKAKLKAPDTAVGKNVKCPGCGTAMTVPAPAAAAAPARPQAPVEDFDPDREDDRPRKAAAKRPPVEEEDDRPRRGSKGRPEPEPDYEEVDSPPRRGSKDRPAANDFADLDAPRPKAKGRADDEDFEDEDRPKKGKGRAVVELPQPRTTKDERSASFLFWVMMFIPCLSPWGSLVQWLMKRKDMPFLDHQGKQMFNGWITSVAVVVPASILAGIIAAVAGMINGWLALGVNVLFFLVFMAYFVMQLVWTITALLKAKNGVWYRLPYTFQIFKTPELEPAGASKKRASRDDDEEFED
jgi:uncharacterized Tic20 family protein